MAKTPPPPPPPPPPPKAKKGPPPPPKAKKAPPPPSPPKAKKPTKGRRKGGKKGSGLGRGKKPSSVPKKRGRRIKIKLGLKQNLRRRIPIPTKLGGQSPKRSWSHWILMRRIRSQK